ncbi:MAG: tRNA uridine-5-carboxymethylaminomethyl(34) synthesis GTPase MnmE, partial [Lachnospiraceae bacterium]|nr:tRNA uridine-5-carboxymethylaminomethyl(34) synthesis GTPase MnmE [Lachnospiraceae bacterium]
VVDSSVSLDENDFEIMKMIKDKKSIVLFNKSDLNSEISLDELKKFLNNDVIIIRTSTKENTGMDNFEKAVKKLFFSGKIDLDSEILITNLRHKQSLQDALESLNMVKESLKADMPEDFYSIDLMNSYASLGKITGEEISDDLMNEIFSKFCMGK